MEGAVQFNPMMVCYYNALGGIYINLNTLPKWIAWLQWLSPTRYTTSIVVQNHFRDNPEVIAEYGLENLSIPMSFVCLAASGVFVKILSLIFLKLMIVRRFQ